MEEVHETSSRKYNGLRRKASVKVSFCVKKERNLTRKKIFKILQKPEEDRSEDDLACLLSCSSLVKEVRLRLDRKKKLIERAAEVEDSPRVLEEKCKQLAEAVKNAQHLIVYSGAGVSTAAKIPDYRGTNGIWTRLQQGKDIGNHDLSTADPTFTHMALSTLYRKGYLKYIVSQNCDGLHLRSGMPRWSLSEVHGNMNLEVCTQCNIQIWRNFDVTQYTARYFHKTARLCCQCHEPLRDTIVHFGERGSLKWPINWTGACQAAKQADVILCVGSSLKVLKRYPWLWGMDKPVRKRPQLYIVNLQWTPKDDQATLKINGKCDEVMAHVMKFLKLETPPYDRKFDPIFHHATLLHPLEEHTISSQPLSIPVQVKDEIKIELEQEKIQEIVLDIKKESEIWRPYDNEIEINPGKRDYPIEEKAASTSPLSQVVDESEGISVKIEIFDQVYQEIAKKVLQQTDIEYYEQLCAIQPLDLTRKKTKTECDFCSENFTMDFCQFYLRREAKLPSSGTPCYCCDSDEEENPQGDAQSADDKKPINPGWFGKGYRKRIKKKK